jgi:hypothetical protein
MRSWQVHWPVFDAQSLQASLTARRKALAVSEAIEFAIETMGLNDPVSRSAALLRTTATRQRSGKKAIGRRVIRHHPLDGSPCRSGSAERHTHDPQPEQIALDATGPQAIDVAL